MSSNIAASEWSRRDRLMDVSMTAGPLPPPERPPFRALVGYRSRSVSAVFAFVSESVGNWLARRRLKALLELDDHLLEDVGFDRQEIEWGLSLPLRTNAADALKDRLHTRRGQKRWMAWFELAAREPDRMERELETGSDAARKGTGLCTCGR